MRDEYGIRDTEYGLRVHADDAGGKTMISSFVCSQSDIKTRSGERGKGKRESRLVNSQY